MQEDICSGKTAYDKKGALSTANRILKTRGTKLRVYQCGDHWHLTHHLHFDRNKDFKLKKILPKCKRRYEEVE